MNSKYFDKNGFQSFFPHISRILTAGVIIFMIVINLIPEPQTDISARKAHEEQLKNLYNQILTWEKITLKYQNYPDGLIKLASLWLKIGNEEKVVQLEEEVKTLYPISTPLILPTPPK